MSRSEGIWNQERALRSEWAEILGQARVLAKSRRGAPQPPPLRPGERLPPEEAAALAKKTAEADRLALLNPRLLPVDDAVHLVSGLCFPFISALPDRPSWRRCLGKWHAFPLARFCWLLVGWPGGGGNIPHLIPPGLAFEAASFRRTAPGSRHSHYHKFGLFARGRKPRRHLPPFFRYRMHIVLVPNKSNVPS